MFTLIILMYVFILYISLYVYICAYIYIYISIIIHTYIYPEQLFIKLNVSKLCVKGGICVLLQFVFFVGSTLINYCVIFI